MNLARLCAQYIAAGLDPARFWEVTPRLYSVEIEGAGIRLEREREMVWWGAMLPHLKKAPDLKTFVGHRDVARTRAERVRQFHAAWDRVDRALARASR
ncbi:hypothetical protein pthi1_p37 [Paracoccus phage vB_PthS_Pthi1]|nr:hypothetical protein pthi1_p37 [Paracoccus phage vB_PthS_Pthi1]